MGKVCPPESVTGYKQPPPQEKGFAASTAAVSGESKRSINQHLARADALGDDLERITGTSLDKGVEMDALKAMPEPERKELIDRAAAGEKVSARVSQKSDYQRGVLALRMKPIMEERARAQQFSTLVQNAAVSQISDERKPIRTDEAVSELANISRDTIPARFVNLDSLLKGEYAENELRKDFTHSERVEIGRALEGELREKAEARMKAGVANPKENFPEGVGQSRDLAAKAAGFG